MRKPLAAGIRGPLARLVASAAGALLLAGCATGYGFVQPYGGGGYYTSSGPYAGYYGAAPSYYGSYGYYGYSSIGAPYWSPYGYYSAGWPYWGSGRYGYWPAWYASGYPYWYCRGAQCGQPNYAGHDPGSTDDRGEEPTRSGPVYMNPGAPRPPRMREKGSRVRLESYSAVRLPAPGRAALPDANPAVHPTPGFVRAPARAQVDAGFAPVPARRSYTPSYSAAGPGMTARHAFSAPAPMPQAIAVSPQPQPQPSFQPSFQPPPAPAPVRAAPRQGSNRPTSEIP